MEIKMINLPWSDEDIQNMDHLVAFVRAYGTNLHKAFERSLKKFRGRTFTEVVRYYRKNYIYSKQYRNTEIRSVDKLVAYYGLQKAVHNSIATCGMSGMDKDLKVIIERLKD